jgi:hypothetical protein
MNKIDITYNFADVILPNETAEILANEAGREAIENLVYSQIEWDDCALEASPGFLGTDASKVLGIPERFRLADLLAKSGIA